MATTTDAPLRRERSRGAGTWVAAALGVSMFASLVWLVSPVYEANADTNDSSMYILSAQALLRGEGYAYLERPFTVRPPGMSVLLAPLVAWRGLDYQAMHVLVSLFGIAGALLLYAWSRLRLGTLVAAALALCLWLNPGYQRFCNQVMSDVPGVALMLAALLVERRWGQGACWKRDALLGALVGLSTYVRTIAILTLVAIAIARVAANARAGPGRRPWLAFARERLAVLVATTLVIVLPWSVRDALVRAEPPADQNFVHSYATGILHVDPGDPASDLRSPADLAATIELRSQQVLLSLGGRLDPARGTGAGAWALAAALLASMLWALVRRVEAGEILGVLVLGVLLVYFGFQARLALPLFVVGLAACAEFARAALSRAVAPRAADGIVAAAILALAAIDLRPAEDRAELESEHAARVEAARQVNAAVPADARIGSRIGWRRSLYLGRPVWSLRFAVDRARRQLARAGPGDPAARAAEARAIRALADAYDLDVIVVGLEAGDQEYVRILDEMYGPGRPIGREVLYEVRR